MDTEPPNIRTAADSGLAEEAMDTEPDNEGGRSNETDKPVAVSELRLTEEDATAPTLTEHHALSTEPHATSTEPHATSTEPHATSTEPHATSTEPHATSTEPDRGIVEREAVMDNTEVEWHDSETGLGGSEQVMQGSTLEDSVLEGPVLEDSVLEGSALESSAIEASCQALEGSRQAVRQLLGPEEGSQLIGAVEDLVSAVESMERPVDEDSLGATSENTTSPQRKTRITNTTLLLNSLPQGVGAEALFEYRWPPTDPHAEYWMLQEQVSVFLEVKSFRRKYPELERRQIDIEERDYIKSVGVVTEMQCDLGLTALKSEDISDLMMHDYPEKYDEYAKVLRKREEQRITKKHQDLQELHNAAPPQVQVSKMDIKRLTERAARSAANYNSLLMSQRREERQHYYDIQTGVVQYPVNRKRALPPEMTRPSVYPVRVLSGQYSDTYNTYTSDELKYLPVKTVLYNPPLKIHNPYVPLPPDEVQRGPVAGQQVEERSRAAPTPPHLSEYLPTDHVVVPTVVPNRKPVTKLAHSFCVLCGREENRTGAPEKCIKCNQCQRETHPTCCELTPEMLAVVITYNWMCMECKVCVECSDPGNEDKMIVCDKCDRGYHTFCVGLKSIPEESTWVCPECTGAA